MWLVVVVILKLFVLQLQAKYILGVTVIMLLGRGSSDGVKIPKLVDKLNDLNVITVFCGGQFSAALTFHGEETVVVNIFSLHKNLGI